MKKLGFAFVILLCSCASMKLSYEEYSRKFADSKKEFTVDRNYQILFSEAARAMETYEQQSKMGNTFSVYSQMHAEDGFGEISTSASNMFTPEKRWGWMRIYKNRNQARVVIYAAADLTAERMEKFAKGELNNKCLKD